jgi:tagatose 6-phosphate kinase
VIVTVTLNPSLQVRYEADRLVVGGANEVSRVTHRASGRGLAVARVLHTFGHDVVAAGLVGGSAGELIKNELARTGVATRFTRIAAESRRVVRIRTAAGDETSFAEPAPYITTEELGRLATDYRGLLDGASAVLLCGSLPAGLPAETYGSLASYAAEARVPVILAAGGSALRHGMSRRPALVIPEPEPAPGASAAAISEQGGASSVILLTTRGVRALTADGEWRAELGQQAAAAWLPAGEGMASSRDALVAGFVPGIALGWSWPDMLRHAVALAAAVPPGGEADLAAYEALLPSVAVAGPQA